MSIEFSTHKSCCQGLHIDVNKNVRLNTVQAAVQTVFNPVANVQYLKRVLTQPCNRRPKSLNQHTPAWEPITNHVRDASTRHSNLILAHHHGLAWAIRHNLTPEQRPRCLRCPRLVDGCPVYPNPDSNEGGGSGTGGSKKTIALGDESELEIHGKGFRFVDPPKEMRAALGSVPCAARSAPWRQRTRRRIRWAWGHVGYVVLVLAGMRAALAASPARASLPLVPPPSPSPGETDLYHLPPHTAQEFHNMTQFVPEVRDLSSTELSKPLRLGTTGASDINFDFLVGLRRQHQAMQAARGVRTRVTGAVDVEKARELSVRQQLIRKFHLVLKEEQDVAVGTGLERGQRWRASAPGGRI
ncbi:hypothetical protein B0H10DRAFT_2194734 [Mycena sp. CBHHK59/15]|nr:hypothetical protein B0H10DRAFT_2194734 [Mycena sp. CBHHK59/15]